mmetsp:Transcript_5654/g.14756  ORF Transcript_5654/g.14756 Transcript_5654/m.14756 type:complete len:269 (+) Transcript_5654:220-1026(+)
MTLIDSWQRRAAAWSSTLRSRIRRSRRSRTRRGQRARLAVPLIGCGRARVAIREALYPIGGSPQPDPRDEPLDDLGHVRTQAHAHDEPDTRPAGPDVREVLDVPVADALADKGRRVLAIEGPRDEALRRVRGEVDVKLELESAHLNPRLRVVATTRGDSNGADRVDGRHIILERSEGAEDLVGVRAHVLHGEAAPRAPAGHHDVLGALPLSQQQLLAHSEHGQLRGRNKRFQLLGTHAHGARQRARREPPPRRWPARPAETADRTGDE